MTPEGICPGWGLEVKIQNTGWPLVREKSGKFEFCKLVREILYTKKVREKSGNFIILAQSMCCSRYFDYLKCEKSVDFFSRSLEAMKTCYF